MRKILLATLFFTFCGQIAIYAQEPEWRISFLWYGPVRTGMTIDQAEYQLDVPLVSNGEPQGGCRYVTAKNDYEGLNFMLINGRIARFDTVSPDYKTSEGIRVGDSEARVKEMYNGWVRVEPHKYTDGHYMVVEDGRSAIVFETDGEKVTMIRAGRYPEVGWVEGCS